VIITEGLANLCLIGASVTVWRAKARGVIEKKHSTNIYFCPSVSCMYIQVFTRHVLSSWPGRTIIESELSIELTARVS
jgi:hypothetical protein